jgi:hypothetical protein
MIVKKIQVGKKPEPVPVPVPKPVSHKNIFGKMIEVLKEDMDKSTLNIRAIISPPPPGWEQYREFIALSKGDNHNGEKE